MHYITMIESDYVYICKIVGGFMFEEMIKKLEQSIKVIADDLAMVRTGRATTSIVENIAVEAYPGTWMKMPEIASISVLDAHMLIIKPWDHSTAKKIETAIQAANIGLSPVIDGEMIRISIPQLSEERRKELVKSVSQKIESGKTILRDIRADEKKTIEGKKGEAGVSEDDIEMWLKEMQKLFDQYIVKVEEMGVQKEKELMQI
jgi:ribosome recycling factor